MLVPAIFETVEHMRRFSNMARQFGYVLPRRASRRRGQLCAAAQPVWLDLLLVGWVVQIFMVKETRNCDMKMVLMLRSIACLVKETRNFNCFVVIDCVSCERNPEHDPNKSSMLPQGFLYARISRFYSKGNTSGFLQLVHEAVVVYNG